jgi:hypothetical protein
MSINSTTIAELQVEFEAITAKMIANLRAEYEERIQNLSKMVDKLAVSVNPEPTPKTATVLVGSKFKWISDTNPQTYRIAVMTAKGLLQVKSVVENCIVCDTSRYVGNNYPLIKKLFADEAEWRASLPQGKIELSLPGDAKRKEIFTPTMSDVEKVEALIKRYKIRHRVTQYPSRRQDLLNAIGRIDYFRNTLNKLSYDEMLQQDLFKKNGGLQWLLHSYSQHRKFVAQAGADADKPIFHYARTGTGSINAMIYGEAHFITVFNDKIATVSMSDKLGVVKFYKDFAEMGNPAIAVLYHKRAINI